ncbi:hypothetical protein FRC02_007781 [Tulasnella sp. 418]|nr:hypothetical protein FRC02_007781 [Tulasnella sp. 418]
MSNLSENVPIGMRRNYKSHEDLKYQDRGYSRSQEHFRHRQPDDKRPLNAMPPDAPHSSAANGSSTSGSKPEHIRSYPDRYSNLSDIDKLRQVKSEIINNQIPFYKPIPRPEALESISILHNKRNGRSDYQSDRGRRWDTPNTASPHPHHRRSRSPPSPNNMPRTPWRGYAGNGDTRVNSEGRDPSGVFPQQRHGYGGENQHDPVPGLNSSTQATETTPGPSPIETTHNLPPRLQRAVRHGSTSSQQPMTASPSSAHGGSFSGPSPASQEAGGGRPRQNSTSGSDPNSGERQDRDIGQFGDRYREPPPYGRSRDYDGPRGNEKQETPASTPHDGPTDTASYRTPRSRTNSRASLPDDKLPPPDFDARLDDQRKPSQFANASSPRTSPHKLDDSRRAPPPNQPSSVDRETWPVRTQGDVYQGDRDDRGRQLGRTNEPGYPKREDVYETRQQISRPGGARDREMPPPGLSYGTSSAESLPFDGYPSPRNGAFSPRRRSISSTGRHSSSFVRPQSRERRPGDFQVDRRGPDDSRFDPRTRPIGQYPDDRGSRTDSDTRWRSENGYRSSSLPRDNNNYPPVSPLTKEGHYRPKSPPRNGTYRDGPQTNYSPSQFPGTTGRGSFKAGYDHYSSQDGAVRDTSMQYQPYRARTNSGPIRRDYTRTDDNFRTPGSFSGSVENNFSRGSRPTSLSRSNSEDVVMRELSRPPSVQDTPLRRDSSMTRSGMSIDDRSETGEDSKRHSLGGRPLSHDPNDRYSTPHKSGYEKSTDSFNVDSIKTSDSPAIKRESEEPAVPIQPLDFKETGAEAETKYDPTLHDAESRRVGLSPDDKRDKVGGGSTSQPAFTRSPPDDQRRPSGSSSGNNLQRGSWTGDRDRDLYADRDRRYSGPGFNGQRPPFDSRPPPHGDNRRIPDRDRHGVGRYPQPPVPQSDFRGPPRPVSPPEFNRGPLRDRLQSPPRSAGGYTSRPSFYPPPPPHMDDRGLKRPRVEDHYPPPSVPHDTDFDRRRPPPQGWYDRDEKDRSRDVYDRPPPQGSWSNNGPPRGTGPPRYLPSNNFGRDRPREGSGAGMDPYGGGYGVVRDAAPVPTPYEHRPAGNGYGPPARWSPPPGGRGREPPYRR